MKPSLGRIVHVTDHARTPKPTYAALIVRCRLRTAEDGPAIERGKETVFAEDAHVVDLRVFTVDDIFTLEDVDFAPDATPWPRWQGRAGDYGTWSWSWPERV